MRQNHRPSRLMRDAGRMAQSPATSLPVKRQGSSERRSKRRHVTSPRTLFTTVTSSLREGPRWRDTARSRDQSPQKTQPKTPSKCDRVASQPGAVFVDFIDASAFAGIGVTGSIGVFYNLKTGSGGFFHTEGGGYGYELGIGIKGGFYGSAADLRGFNYNLNGSYAVSGSANFSKDGRLVGGSVGPAAKAGGSATATNTTFFGCHYVGG